MVSETEITNALKTVIDPELGYNIVDLGLIYDIRISSSSESSESSGRPPITIVMTLTTPGCPLAPYFSEKVKETAAAAAGLQPEDIDLNLTFDPPWTKDAIHPDLRLELGL